MLVDLKAVSAPLGNLPSNLFELDKRLEKHFYSRGPIDIKLGEGQTNWDRYPGRHP